MRLREAFLCRWEVYRTAIFYNILHTYQLIQNGDPKGVYSLSIFMHKKKRGKRILKESGIIVRGDRKEYSLFQ